MRHFKIFFLVILTTVLSVSACGAQLGNAPSPAVDETPQHAPTSVTLAPTAQPRQGKNSVSDYFLPSYYSRDYLTIIEGSKSEASELVLYSEFGAESWQFALQAFRERYPWINVSVQTFSGADLFNQNTPPADIIISSALDGWAGFLGQESWQVYISQEDILLPAWSKPAAGVYTVLAEPFIIVYSREKVTETPQTLTNLNNYLPVAEVAERIATLDPAVNFSAYAANWAYVNANPELSWDSFKTIGLRRPLLLATSDQVFDSVANGQAAIGYFVSAYAVIPQIKNTLGLGWSYIYDGQPVLLHYAAVTKESASPNSAKLMMDFLLSQEGQLALAFGGGIPYRSDVKSSAILHLDFISEAVGVGELILIPINAPVLDSASRAGFLSRWHALMNP